MNEMGEPTIPQRSLAQWFIYYITLWCAFLTLKFLFRFKRFGVSNIPRTGGVLLVANHQSYIDPPLVAVSMMHRQMHAMARASLFESKLFGWYIRMLNTIPLREDGKGDTAPMKDALARMNRGAAVVIFPEGSRSETGEIGEFQRGAGLLIKRSKCPVVPMAIEGAFEAWPRGRTLPRFRTRVWVQIGTPIEHDELMEQGMDAGMQRLRTEVVALRNDLRRRMGKER